MKVTCPICRQERDVNTAKQPSAVCRSCAQKIKKSVEIQKLCAFCNQPFTTKTYNKMYCDREHYRLCPICGKQYLEDNNENLKNPPVACSYKCRAAATRQTSLIRYGCAAPGNSDDARDKARKTMRKKFGADYTMQSPELRDKVIATNRIKYGADNPANNINVLIRRMQTNRQKYGDTMPFNRPQSLEKAKKTLLERYGVDNGFLTPNGVSATNLVRNSKINQEFAAKLDGCGIRYECEYQIKNRFYDFLLPDVNMLIEVNPSYTHSVLNDNIDKYYHIDKTNLAKQNGFNCQHVWDWDNKTRIIASLLPKTKLSAEELNVIVLSEKYAKQFITDNHLQDSRRNKSLTVGLVKGGDIYQTITVCSPTYQCNHDIQISNMCTKIGYEINGGYDKLTTYLSQMGLYDAVAYADLAKTDGKELATLGLEFDHNSPPRLIWSKGVRYVSSSLVVRGRGPYNTEEEFLENGWLPVYDCGQAVYEYRKSSQD